MRHFPLIRSEFPAFPGSMNASNAEIRDLPPNTGVCISEHRISLVSANWGMKYDKNLIIMTAHTNIT